MAEKLVDNDQFELCTVGIDIGSATSQVAFSIMKIRRLSNRLSSQYEVLDRNIVWKSPILLTPFTSTGLIDVDILERFVDSSFCNAGVERQSIDSGAVILTGKALERENARSIAELFSNTSGKFVCAEAGNIIEAELAAFGSGAAEISQGRTGRVLNVDIGGGTTKLSVLQRGRMVTCGVLGIGGRLLAWDDERRVTRIEWPIDLISNKLGWNISVGDLAHNEKVEQIASVMAEVLVYVISSGKAGNDFYELCSLLWLTNPIGPQNFDSVIFSGGVSEYINKKSTVSYGDIGLPLAKHISGLLPNEMTSKIEIPKEGIRATIVGSCQFSTQISGSTSLVTGPECLPLRNLPILRFPGSLDTGWTSSEISEWIALMRSRWNAPTDASIIGVAFSWKGPALYSRLRAVAEGLLGGINPARDLGVVLLVDNDVGLSLGRMLVDDLGYRGSVISLDGLQVDEYDFVDISEPQQSSGAVVVTVKSLLFDSNSQ